MIKNIKNSFKILIKNSALMQPIVFFVLFLLFFNMFMGMKVLVNPNMGIIFIVLSVLIFSAFLSGWLYMIKYAIDNYRVFAKNEADYEEKVRKNNLDTIKKVFETDYAEMVGRYNVDTLKKFFIGVGEYFLPVILFTILCIIISNLLILAGQKALNISDLTFLTKGLAAQTVQDLPKISIKQTLFLLYIDGITFIFHFLTLFWLPEIFYKSKNVLAALFGSMGFLFKNFLTSIGLYLFLVFCFFAFMIITFITSFIPFMPLVMFLILLYLFNYSFILIFMTYKGINDKKEIEEMNNRDVFIKSKEESNNDI